MTVEGIHDRDRTQLTAGGTRTGHRRVLPLPDAEDEASPNAAAVILLQQCPNCHLAHSHLEWILNWVHFICQFDTTKFTVFTDGARPNSKYSLMGEKETRQVSTDWALVAINPSRLQTQQHGDCVSGNMPFPYGNNIQFSGAFDRPITEPFFSLELQKSDRSSQITFGTCSELECVMFTQVRGDDGQIAIVPT
ncbi:uncharacterized protein N7515_010192 [Penicillium bovifimosum]|uniref:Uncharacterized protein n=1 Tax=Penicillium bovifimosum TaxID=126998 RepID=A0A9W9KV22_9EURO|nr:uncharacterized protein N7515_010192 [Penicillium bovifimosum]KAJ5120804.1 hypothetical protein N7515_010192 [Penicillium bovifimosum]